MNPHQQPPHQQPQHPQYPGKPQQNPQQYYPGQQPMYNPQMGYPQGQRYPGMGYPQGEGVGTAMGQYGAMQGQQGTFQPINIKQEPHWGAEGYQMQMQQHQFRQYPQQPPQQHPQLQQPPQQPMLHHPANIQPQQVQPPQPLLQQVPNPQYQHMEHEHQIHIQPHPAHAAQLQAQQQAAQLQQQQQQQIPKSVTPQLQPQPQPPQVQQHTTLQATQSGGPGSATLPASISSAASSRIANKEDAQQQQQPQPKVSAADMAEDLERFNVGELCALGKELVADLTFKTSQLSSVLKKVMEKKTLQTGEDPPALSDQCKQHLEKLVEIRLLIESRRKPDWIRMTAEDYIAMVLEDDDKERATEVEHNEEMMKRIPIKTSKEPPREGLVWYKGRWIPESLEKKYAIFDENRTKLVQLSCDMKGLNWMVEVSSPTALKKVDKTKFTKKKPESN